MNNLVPTLLRGNAMAIGMRSHAGAWERGSYDRMKDSGVEWLGEIPKHWEVKRLASFGVFSKGGGFSKSDLSENGVSAILYGDIYTKYNFVINSVERNIRPSVAINSVKLRYGDILFTGSGETKEDIGKCVVFNSHEEAVAGGDIILFKQKENNNLFLGYCLNTHEISMQKAKFSKGEIIVHTYASKLRELYISLPPLPEQKAIADFLDRKISQIDEAVAIKQKQIALLKERKQILIQNAVTQGLNPNAPKRDSGVEWIGEIPAHWKILSNRSLFNERVEPGRKELPLLSVSIHSAVSNKEMAEDDNIRGRVKIEDKSKYNLVQPNDIVYNMMRAWQGAIGAVKVEGMVSPAYTIAVPNGLIDSSFFEYQYRSPIFIQQMDRNSKGITDFRKRLYWDEFKQLVAVTPPKEEQTAIVAHIEAESAKIDQAIDLSQQQIEKLIEYKATLINSTVTGKIKVDKNSEGEP